MQCRTQPWQKPQAGAKRLRAYRPFVGMELGIVGHFGGNDAKQKTRNRLRGAGFKWWATRESNPQPWD